MSIIPATKSERKRQNITVKMCEARVTRQTKTYDAKVSGLYVSVTPKGAVFNLKYTDAATRKRSSIKIGVYHREMFNVEHARIEAMALKFRIGRGEDIAQTARQAKARQAKLSGVTVDQVIEERIAWMQTPVRKADGELRPRIESWSNVASHLDRFVSPRLGKKVASEVTKGDIAQLSNDIVAGGFGKPSTSNARHMRRAASAMFKWAAQAGRDYVSASPCIDLPPLDEEHPRDRVLSEDEIRTLWHGLDREDMPWDRRTRLALRLALVTMLRSSELLHIHRDELNYDNGQPCVDIPAKRVKKRRVISQPLSDLALGIINEAMGNYEYVFTGRFGDAPLARNAMASALRGKTKKVKGKIVIESEGICRMLGMRPFTPHDLRRTAATMCGELGLSEAGISLCLDHQANKDENGKPLPAVTRKVYNLATRARVAKKREVLDAWAVELRRIIGEPMTAREELRQAA
jgi:integrase